MNIQGYLRMDIKKNTKWITEFLIILLSLYLIGKVNSWLIGFRIPLESDSFSILYNYVRFGGKKIQILIFFFTIWAVYFSFIKRIPSPKGSERIFSFVCIALLIWTFGFYSYNFFFDQFHWVDRIIIILLGVLSCYKPNFIPLFLILCIGISKQFYLENLFSYTFTDKRIVFSILWFFFIWQFLFKRVFKSGDIFFIVIIAIIFHWYFWAGIGKISLNWVTENNSYYLAFASYIYGWFYFLSPEFNRGFFEFLFQWNNVFEICALVFEVGVVFLLFVNRTWNRLVIVASILMHIGIFISTGIFFWKWIAILSTLLLLSFLSSSDHALNVKPLLNRRILFLIIVLTLPFLLRTTQLAWLDSGYITKYTVVINSSGNTWERIDSSFFSPYDISFAQNRFSFLDTEKSITGTYGSTIDRALKELVYKKDFTDIDSYNKFTSMGKLRFDDLKTKKFKAFVNTYVQRRQQPGSNWLSYFSPPRHIWQGKKQDVIGNKINQIGVLIERIQIMPKFGFKLIESDTIVIGKSLEN